MKKSVHLLGSQLTFLFTILFFLNASLVGVMAQNHHEEVRRLEASLAAYEGLDEKKVDLLNELSYAYRRISPVQVDSIAYLALNLAIELNYKKGLGIAYKNIGIAKWKLGNPSDIVITYWLKALKLSEEEHDYYTQVACLNNLGLAYTTSFEYVEALQAYQKATAIHQQHLPMDRLRVLLISNIGATYTEVEDYPKALIYLEDALSLASEYQHYSITAMIIDTYVYVKQKMGGNFDAIEKLKKHLPEIESIGDYQSWTQSCVLLSSLLLEAERYTEAEMYLEKGLLWASRNSYNLEYCDLLRNKAMAHYGKQEYEEAERLGEEAFACTQKTGQDLQRLKAAKSLINIYLHTGMVEKLKLVFPIYEDLQDRNFDIEKQKNYARIEAEFQNKRKEEENVLLKSQQIQNVTTIRTQRLHVIALLILGVLLALVSLWAYRMKLTQTSLLEDRVEERTQELNLANRKLEKSNEELEQFAYIASHDLKQPLNTIICFSKLLDKEVDHGNAKTDQYMGFILQASVRMKNLIEDLLEYSKISREKREPQMLDLDEILEEIQSLNPAIKNSAAQITVKAPLPILFYERTKIILLFKNLIENAIKYNQSTLPTIEIEAKKNANYFLLSFQDNGIGIDEKYFPKLFKMFSRLENKSNYEGIFFINAKTSVLKDKQKIFGVFI
ncbi:MAG: tetratricopeptide repeat protein [Bacteroidota bacterium]